jgi:hypothetical protein
MRPERRKSEVGSEAARMQAELSELELPPAAQLWQE